MEFFDAFLVVDGGNEHPAGVDAHHGPRRQIRDGDAGLADELFRLVVLVDTGKDDSVGAGAVIQHEFQEFLDFLTASCLTNKLLVSYKFNETFILLTKTATASPALSMQVVLFFKDDFPGAVLYRKFHYRLLRRWKFLEIPCESACVRY